MACGRISIEAVCWVIYVELSPMSSPAIKRPSDQKIANIAGSKR